MVLIESQTWKQDAMQCSVFYIKSMLLETIRALVMKSNIVFIANSSLVSQQITFPSDPLYHWSAATLIKASVYQWMAFIFKLKCVDIFGRQSKHNKTMFTIFITKEPDSVPFNRIFIWMLRSIIRLFATFVIRFMFWVNSCQTINEKQWIECDSVQTLNI